MGTRVTYAREFLNVMRTMDGNYPGIYPVFTVVMVIYHYVERIGELSLLLNFLYNIYDYETIFPGEPVNIHIQSLINIIQDNNRVITIKKDKVKSPLFCGNREW